VSSRKIEWLWYPYIPYGKVTIIQGDPGEGKTAFVLNLASLLTRGLEDYEINQNDLIGESRKCDKSKLELAINKLGDL